MRTTERTLTSADGFPLLVRHHLPSSGPTGRTLLIAHGVCEHGGRYEHVAEAAANNDWETIVADHRGHGRSGGERTHIETFHDYLTDLDLIRSEFKPNPVTTALLGHSMGGLVAIRFAQEFSHQIAALALSGPFLKPGRPPHRLKVAAGRVVRLVAPRTRFATGIAPEQITSDTEILRIRENDPLMQTSVTAGWFFAARAALKLAWGKAPEMRLPLLVMQGGRDSIVDPIAAECWAEECGSADKTFQIFPEQLHELLNESARDETIRGLFDWLNARIPVDSV